MNNDDRVDSWTSRALECGRVFPALRHRCKQMEDVHGVDPSAARVVDGTLDSGLFTENDKLQWEVRKLRADVKKLDAEASVTRRDRIRRNRC